MLAMARALCIDPKVLLLDEPTEGLMPSMIARIRQSVLDLKAHGVTIDPGRAARRCGAAGRRPRRLRREWPGNGVVPVAALAADRKMIDRYVGVGA